MSAAAFFASSMPSTGEVVPGTIGTPASDISSRARVFDPIVAIGLRVDGDRGDSHLLQRPHHADRDLAPVRHQDLLEHGAGVYAARRWRSASPIQITWSRPGPTPTSLIGAPARSATKSR